uniref:ABC transporter ATP-binding protein n=1 Tax=Alistipes sp. TaxID=1872444 RepID=UPI00405682A0
MKSTLWRVIPRNYRRRVAGVTLTIFLRALLNFVGIATLIPILTLMLEGEDVASNRYLGWLYEAVGAESYMSFVVVVCSAVVVFILLKNVITLILYRTERNFIYSLYKRLSERLYLAYHERGYGYVKQNNSAILTRNVNVVSLLFVAGVLKPIATIIGEVLLLGLIFVALVWYTPVVALLAVGLFAPVVALFYLSMRRKLHDIGQRENEAQRVKSRIIAESFRGYADVEIGGAFPQMFKRFEEAMDEVVELRKRNATIGMLPQMFTEVGLALGLSALVVVSIGTSSDDMALMFGIFAVAAIRLIPSVRSIMSGWSAIRYNKYTIETLVDVADDEVDERSIEPCKDRMEFKRSIELRELCFRFDDAVDDAIHNLSLTINHGERLGIRGSSGVGKTTLFNLILGLYCPTSGGIYVDGERLDGENIRKWQNTIGYVSQLVFIADLTLAENIAFGCDAKEIDYARVNEVVELANLKDFVASLGDGLNARIGEQGSRISGGQRQRIGIARALYKGCDVLFFDEATSSLDDRTEENINSAIRKLSDENRSLTIVVIAHRESSLEYCDRIITLE